MRHILHAVLRYKPVGRKSVERCRKGMEDCRESGIRLTTVSKPWKSRKLKIKFANQL